MFTKEEIEKIYGALSVITGVLGEVLKKSNEGVNPIKEVIERVNRVFPQEEKKEKVESKETLVTPLSLFNNSKTSTVSVVSVPVSNGNGGGGEEKVKGTLTWTGEKYLVVFEYRKWLKDKLKEKVPYQLRAFNGETKVWTVDKEGKDFIVPFAREYGFEMKNEAVKK